MSDRDDLARLLRDQVNNQSTAQEFDPYVAMDDRLDRTMVDGQVDFLALADAMRAAGWRPPNPCDHSAPNVRAPQYHSDPPTFWCQMCGERGLTSPGTVR